MAEDIGCFTTSVASQETNEHQLLKTNPESVCIGKGRRTVVSVDIVVKETLNPEHQLLHEKTSSHAVALHKYQYW